MGEWVRENIEVKDLNITRTAQAIVIGGESVFIDFSPDVNPYFYRKEVNATYFKEHIHLTNGLFDYPAIFVQFDDPSEAKFYIERPTFINKKFDRIYLTNYNVRYGKIIFYINANPKRLVESNWVLNDKLYFQDIITANNQALTIDLMDSIQVFFKKLRVKGIAETLGADSPTVEVLDVPRVIGISQEILWTKNLNPADMEFDSAELNLTSGLTRLTFGATPNDNIQLKIIGVFY